MSAPEAPKFTPDPTQGSDVRSIRDLIKNELANLDKNSTFSDEEKAIAEKTLKQLESNYGTATLDVQRNTKNKLAALRQEITGNVAQLPKEMTEKIEKYIHEPRLNRTDIPDLSTTFSGIVRRVQIEDKMKSLTVSPALLSEIETVDDLRKLPVETLIKLEDEHEGILLYAFTDIASGDTKIDLENFYLQPQEGVTLRVDFRGNMEAEAKIGAGDIFPPSVRCITCYERGDKTIARTSTKRIGLKGRNKDGTGFFDGKGYIPVYSGDTVVIGGSDKGGGDKKSIDHDFEKKYRGKDNKLDYAAYEKDFGVEEKKYLDEVEKQHLPTHKQYTPEELSALEQRINASGIRKKIVATVMQFIEKGTPGKHCWDWIEQIYRAAGADHQNVYRGSNYVNNLKRWDAGFDTNPKNPPMVNDLQPGDWFFVYNRNGIDDRDAHSVIFLSWENQAEHIAKVASCPHSGSPGRIHDVNLNNKPMVFAMKPVSNGKAAIG